jgi:hypothetical protein
VQVENRQTSYSAAALAGVRKPRGRCAAAVRRLLVAVCVVCLSQILFASEIAKADSIKWGTVLADDYDRGVAEHKPIVVLFYDITTSRYDADVLSTQVLMSASLGKAAGSAVWSFADVSKDLVARNIAKALGIKTFPTISVLKPDPDALDETSRVVGLLPIATTEVGVMRGIERASKK